MRRRAADAGAEVRFHALAAIKSTRSCWLTRDGRSDPGLEGRLLGGDAIVVHRPGVVPRAIARAGASGADWSHIGWDFRQFDLPEPEGAWFPHIGLCEILDDLIRKVTQ